MNFLRAVITTLIFLGAWQLNLLGLQKGSMTAISVEPLVTFPAADNDNEMLAFGYFSSGVILQDAKTSATSRTIFEVGEELALNGGTLYLQESLALSAGITLTSGGTINGEGRSIKIDPMLTVLGGGDYDFNFTDVKLYLSGNMTLSGTLNFNGDSVLNGNGASVVLDAGAEIVVGEGATLALNNMQLCGVNGSKVRCADSTSSIVLDNITWIQDGDYTFAQGAITFKSATTMKGDHTFIYQTLQTSTVAQGAELVFDVGFTFSYDPAIAANNLLELTDKSSILRLNDGVEFYSQVGGLQLTKGTMHIDGHVMLTSDVLYTMIVTDTVSYLDREEVQTGGLSFGSGAAQDDLYVKLSERAQLHVVAGRLHHYNTVPTLMVPASDSSILFIDTGAELWLHESLDIQNGLVMFADKAALHKEVGTTLSGSILAQGELLSALQNSS